MMPSPLTQDFDLWQRRSIIVMSVISVMGMGKETINT
jgi:hypothetical protein